MSVTPILDEVQMREFLGIPGNREIKPFSWRKSYYCVHDSADPDSIRVELSPENIAMLLTIPQVMYDNYDSNLPIWPRFVTAPTAYDTTSFKNSGKNRRSSWIKKIVRRPTDGVSPVSIAEIMSLEPAYVWTDPIPCRYTMKKRRDVVPHRLLDELKQAKEYRRCLEVAEQSKLPSHQRLTKKELNSAQRRLNREISRLNSEIDQFEKYRLRPIEIPNTGRASFKIEIPMARDGSQPILPMQRIRDYIREAWGDKPTKDPDVWLAKWNRFENLVLFKAFRVGFLGAIRKSLDESLRHDDPYAILRKQWIEDSDDTARENARQNYVGERGTPIDWTIRRVEPGYKDWDRGRRKI